MPIFFSTLVVESLRFSLSATSQRTRLSANRSNASFAVKNKPFESDYKFPETRFQFPKKFEDNEEKVGRICFNSFSRGHNFAKISSGYPMDYI